MALLAAFLLGAAGPALSLTRAAGNVSWTSFGANVSMTATSRGAVCEDGRPAPQAYLMNMLFNDHYTQAGKTVDLSGLPAVDTQSVA
jgi:hypothetical protein|eukprot:COSAG02_NODE_1604_length_11728_cov_42.819417_12_plen_87_part_00